MARKQIRVSRRMLLTWLALGSFILLFTPQSLTSKFQFAFTRIFHWPLRVGRSMTLSARTQQPLTDFVSRKEYIRLQNHLANVESLLTEEHAKVQELSGLKSRLPLDYAKLVPADVTTASVQGTRNELIINRGEKDGLSKGLFVLGDNSIIGRICSVDTYGAKVKLITDSTSRIGVKIGKLKLSTIMQGGSNNTAKILMVSTKHKVRIGDKVFVDKEPGFLDWAMIAGKVVKYKRDDENPLLWDIAVEPSSDIEELKSVAVIMMNPEK